MKKLIPRRVLLFDDFQNLSADLFMFVCIGIFNVQANSHVGKKPAVPADLPLLNRELISTAGAGPMLDSRGGLPARMTIRATITDCQTALETL